MSKNEMQRITKTLEAFIPNYAGKLWADLEGKGRQVLFAFKSIEDADHFRARALSIPAKITIEYELPANRRNASNVVYCPHCKARQDENVKEIRLLYGNGGQMVEKCEVCDVNLLFNMVYGKITCREVKA